MSKPDVATAINAVEEAAIDAFMAAQSYRVSGDGQRYVLWGWFDSMSYDRFGGNWMGSLASVAGSHAENFSMIRNYIRQYTSRWKGLPSATACVSFAASADRAAGELGTGRRTDAGADAMSVNEVVNLGIDDIRSDLAAIDGKFTGYFREKYVTGFKTINRNLGIACATLGGAYAAQDALWNTAPKDVTKILATTRDALLAQVKSSNLDDAKASFAIMSAVTGAIGTVVSGGTLPIVFGLTSAGVSLIGDGVTASASISGDSYKETLQSMGSALDALNVSVTGLERGLATLLSNTTSYMNSNSSKVDLDKYVIATPYDGVHGIMSMPTTNSDAISKAMAQLHAHLGATLTRFGAAPASNPTSRSTDVGLSSSGIHSSSIALHSAIAAALTHTRDEYGRGHGLFDATVQAFLSADADAAARVVVLAQAEAVVEAEG